MATIDGRPFRVIRADAVRAANELGYGAEVADKVKQAKTENEITNILTNARKSGCRENIEYDPRYYKF